MSYKTVILGLGGHLRQLSIIVEFTQSMAQELGRSKKSSGFFQLQRHYLHSPPTLTPLIQLPLLKATRGMELISTSRPTVGETDTTGVSEGVGATTGRCNFSPECLGERRKRAVKTIKDSPKCISSSTTNTTELRANSLPSRGTNKISTIRPKTIATETTISLI
jgi:hypothetical protein